MDNKEKLVLPTSEYIINVDAKSITEPAMVYINNKNVARTLLFLEPQIPIIKNIGIKILSKKKKKVIISKAVKASIKKISKRIKKNQ